MGDKQQRTEQKIGFLQGFLGGELSRVAWNWKDYMAWSWGKIGDWWDFFSSTGQGLVMLHLKRLGMAVNTIREVENGDSCWRFSGMGLVVGVSQGQNLAIGAPGLGSGGGGKLAIHVPHNSSGCQSSLRMGPNRGLQGQGLQWESLLAARKATPPPA